MMRDRIAVRKLHRRARLYNEQMRHELPVDLVHGGDSSRCRRLIFSIQPQRIHRNVSDRVPALVDNDNDYVDVMAERQSRNRQR